MDKVFVGESEYSAVSNLGMLEDHFEQIIYQHAHQLYPGYYVVPFAPLVESLHGANQPDIALVSRNLDYWYVVEAEMAHHSLNGHVLPQVRTFAHANYATRQVIEALQSGLPKVDQRDLIRLVRDVHPEVLVIVYGSASDWREPLLGVPSLLHEIRLFRPLQGPPVLYMDGPTLRQPSLLAFSCVHRIEMASLLFLDGTMGDTIPKRIEIEVEEAIIQAEVLDQDHLTVLRSPAFRDLAPGQYQLIQSESGSFNLGKI